VPAELVDHRLAENRTFSRVVKNVEAYEARVQIAIDHRVAISGRADGDRA
jgi:hypothetical protein